MIFKFSCPHCGQRISAETTEAGKDTSCPSCSQPFVIPAPEPGAETPQPAPSQAATLSIPAAMQVFGSQLLNFGKAAWKELKRALWTPTLKAKIQKLRLVELKRAHHALGLKAFEGRVLPDQFAPRYDEIEALAKKIATEREGVKSGESATAVERLKTSAVSAEMKATATAHNIKLNGLYTNLGADLAAKDVPDSCRAEMDAVRGVETGIQDLEKELLANTKNKDARKDIVAALTELSRGRSRMYSVATLCGLLLLIGIAYKVLHASGTRFVAPTVMFFDSAEPGKSFRNTIGAGMVWIAPGNFKMGDQTGKGNPVEKPVHEVRLASGYWLGESEVTQGQWQAVMGSNPSKFKGENRPVEHVSWDDAVEFCKKLTAREHAAGRLSSALEYRLPTEAQWEYACRAGTTGDYAGDFETMVWCLSNSGNQAHDVKTKRPNAWGLYDMHGNVWEWCADWYGTYATGLAEDPIGPSFGTERVWRGGSWNYGGSHAHSASRQRCIQETKGASDLGFRVAAVPATSSQIGREAPPEDAEAQFRIGCMYRDGKGVTGDWAEAAKWFRKAAEQGHGAAQNSLGAMYQKGHGVPEDQTEAVKWFRLAAEQGVAEAHLKLSHSYSGGKGVVEDRVEAYKWALLAIANGNEDAKMFILLLENDITGRPPLTQSQQAEGKQRAREFILRHRKSKSGGIHTNGVRNPSTEFEDLERAAEQGDAEAQFELGAMYAESQDWEGALKWYRRAADKGNPSAQNSLGAMYKFGNVVTKDESEAVRWFRKAAEQGDAAGQFNLGRAYGTGEGAPMDAEKSLQWILKAADNGLAEAQHTLGVLSDAAQTVPKAEAVEWYRKAAEQGHTKSQFVLGNMYAKGRGVPQDVAEAYKWWLLASAQGDENATKGIANLESDLTQQQRKEGQQRAREFKPRKVNSNAPESVTKPKDDPSAEFGDLEKAAKQGDARAQFKLGFKYAMGEGVPKDATEAVKWFRKSADQGHAPAQYNLGFICANGQGVSKDEAEAVKWFRKAADQEYAAAQYNLGVMYENGLGVSKDEAEAVKWYRKSADQKYAAAQNNLGVMYAKARGVRKDDDEAVQWYRRAAEQGFAKAQFNLGCMYRDGQGVSKNMAEAAGWFRKASDQGYARAQNTLGAMYYNGQGMDKDENEAVKWYRKAADQGYAASESNLGHAYANGRGVRKDEAEAVKWYRKAAEQGFDAAQNYLGAMYCAGTSVPQDIAEGYKWLLLAGAQGNEVAKEALANLERYLLAKERTEGQRRAREFKPSKSQ